MYYAVVVLLMAVFPVLSVLWNHAGGTPLAEAALTWFTFWPVGLRLGLAGLRQTLKPQVTAQSLFNITDPSALPIVRELGFGNLALALPALIVPWATGWAVPVALAGGTFYALAGIGHILSGHRNAQRQVAMISDLAIAVVLYALIAAHFLQG